jgi:hypothetical protein
MTATLTDVLNRERAITRTYADGSFDCPFCAVAVITPAVRCENPGCSASTYAMADPRCAVHFREQAERDEARKAEEARRRRDAEWAMKRHQEEQTERAAWIAEQHAEQERRGTCRRCLNPDPFRRVARFVKHRNACPQLQSR